MTKIVYYDLEERTFKFAENCKEFCKTIPKTISNIEYIKQLIRSSASVGANYIEANESLSQKDFIMRIKISKKEAKESCYWLRIIDCPGSLEIIQKKLVEESTQLVKIFMTIIKKCSINL